LDVDAGFCLNHGLFDQLCQGQVVQDVPRLIQPTVLAVAGEGVERHVGHDAQIGKMIFECANHSRYQTIWVQGFIALWVFQSAVDHRKQGHDRNAQLDAVFGHRQQQVQTEPLYTGHRTDGLALVLTIQYKDGVDQVVDRELMLAHQTTGEISPS
jgi:hypothetical protein